MGVLPFVIAISAAFAQSAPQYSYAPGESAAVLLVMPVPGASAEEQFKVWQPLAAARKWHIAMPISVVAGDVGLKTVDDVVKDLRKKPGLAEAAIYLTGGGPATPLVFYAAFRLPDAFTAVLAIGGDAKPATDSDRLYAANTTLLPIGWALQEAERVATAIVRQRMTTAGANITLLEAPTVAQALDFLARHKHQPNPPKIDCEFGNPALSRCYWIQAKTFDPALRNDALRSTRIPADLQGSLDFGGFGYKIETPGPGVVVEWLPPNYTGSLQMGDRLLALSGSPIADAKHYQELMSQVTEEKLVAVTVERTETAKGGKQQKERIRLTTRYQLPKRPEVITGRVQAEWAAEAREIVIVSRAVESLELSVPPQWAPSSINWNGTVVAQPQNPGCLLLNLKSPGASRPCANSETR